MDENRKEAAAKVLAACIIAVMVVFTIWFVATLVFDPGPAPCTQLGGC